MTQIEVAANVELKDVDQNGKDLLGQEDERNMEKLQGFLPLYVIVQVIGITITALIFYFTLIYSNGYNVSTAAIFNWHPLLMYIGLIYLTGNGLLSFRLLRNLNKNRIKIVHAALNGTGFFIGLLGGIAVLVFHIKANIPNFYSIHSWVGILAMGLFMIQGGLGFTAFMFPVFKEQLKAALLPYHVFFGQVIFVLGVVAAISGITENAIFKLAQSYAYWPVAGILLNSIGILIVIFATIVIYLSTNIYYKRRPRSGDDVVVEKTNS